jgi:lipid IVA palmitoyltransferase
MVERYLVAALLCFTLVTENCFSAETTNSINEGGNSWFSSTYETAKTHITDIVTKGDWEVYVPFWAKHFGYSNGQGLANPNEHPWGAGIGKGFYNSSGNWEGLYAMEFQDSNGQPQYQVGYGWIPTWRPSGDNFRVGAGLTGFIFLRSSYLNYTPLPAVLPIASVGYGPFDVQMAYVPDFRNNGNVLFWWAKYSFK